MRSTKGKPAGAGRYRKGQRWAIRTRLEEFEHTLLIGEVDHGWFELRPPSEHPYLVYVRYNHAARAWTPPGVEGVALALTPDGLDRSVTRLLTARARMPDLAGYREKKARDAYLLIYQCDDVDQGLRDVLESAQREEEGRRLRSAAVSVREVVRQLTPWRKAHQRPAWRPLTRRGDPGVVASKFSGTPWLAAGEAWPTCPGCKEPMPLFLQLNLGDLPSEVAGRFGTGLLQLFYCTTQDRRFDEIPINERFSQAGRVFCQADLVSRPFAPGKLVRVVQPDRRGRKPAVPFKRGYFPARAIVGWKRLTDYPSDFEHAELGLRYKYDFSRHTTCVECPVLGLTFDHQPSGVASAIAKAREGDKLAGWPRWVQGVAYPRCPRCRRRMELVFQLDSNDHLPYMFGDMECGHITQCPRHKDVVTFAWDCS